MKIIEGQSYSWDAVATRILSLKCRLGFSEEISFLRLSIDDRGNITLDKPGSSSRVLVNDDWLSYCVNRVLFYYAMGDETGERGEAQQGHTKESFTKISLLDDSMHLGCSTNQHRIENELKALLDESEEKVRGALERHLGASPVEQGDLAWRIPLLPRVVALIVYNRTEDASEGLDADLDGTANAAACLPSTLNVFFEKSTARYLPPNACETLESIALWVLKVLVSTA
ncbi:MAG: DUF3786 domain-containing protein [Candidatus Lokiarchaeota archaeon]|nr:DUF3786 domain-containing protein [Candidatus Lokiarchaeota archaeon]